MGIPPPFAAVIGFAFATSFIVIGLVSFRHGKDNTVSLSNVQLVLWSGVILGSYVGMAALKGAFLGDISSNLLALMGISAGSYVAAASTRSVQEGKKNDGQATPAPKKMPDGTKVKHRTWGLLSSESDPTNLSIPKLQVFFWTLVVILIYVLITAGNFATGNASLPDPGSGLVALMGISHGAYLGNKISDPPQGSSNANGGEKPVPRAAK